MNKIFQMKENRDTRLLRQAKAVLSHNLQDGFTIPRAKLYPFQWNWDSGFVSLGFANYDVDAAINEINSLLSGQWENGMVPHIIFHSENETTYFPNWDFWETTVNKGASQSPKTSGISQPPVLGFVLENILDKHPDDKKVLAFAKMIYPKLVHYHRFWYTYRDPNREGLVFIYHPWESGRDNSPIWDDALDLIDLDHANLPHYIRQDTKISDAKERPTSRQYDQYVYLLELGKRYQYDGKGIAETSEFLIQDSLINAVLIRSNEGLIKVGKRLGFDTKEIEEWQTQSVQQFNTKLWSEKLQTYTGYDLRQAKQFPHWEIGGLTALFANIPNSERAVKMKAYLSNLMENNFYTVPSFDVYHELYDSKRYWRGPIWPQMNWMIYHGLKQYQFQSEADFVRESLLSLVERFGFHEYFEAQRQVVEVSHGGYGGNDFSWTASSVIDFILCG